jgi:hypothetical protein
MKYSELTIALWIGFIILTVVALSVWFYVDHLINQMIK